MQAQILFKNGMIYHNKMLKYIWMISLIKLGRNMISIIKDSLILLKLSISRGSSWEHLVFLLIWEIDIIIKIINYHCFIQNKIFKTRKKYNKKLQKNNFTFLGFWEKAEFWCFDFLKVFWWDEELHVVHYISFVYT